MVAPLDVASQSWADRVSPAKPELMPASNAHQNMPPAVRARLRAVAAGTMSMAVTSSTPTAQTENMTTRASRPAKRYCQRATRMPCTLAMTGLRAIARRRL